MTQPVVLAPVTADNWRVVEAVTVTPAQQAYMETVAHYLLLCHYGGLWQPLALLEDGEVVGFAMWARDDADGSHWIGGLSVDAVHQGRGVGRAAVLALMAHLQAQPGFREVALSYDPGNTRAERLYASLGFVETGEEEYGETVGRWRPP